MSLFDKLRNASTSNLSPKAAMLLACISMVGADGHIDDDEVNIVIRIDGNELSPDWERAVRTWQQVSHPDECIALVTPCLDTMQRRFTLANLVDIAMADGSLATAEQRLLEGYVQAFELGSDFIEMVADVIAAKNDRSPFR